METRNILPTELGCKEDKHQWSQALYTNYLILNQNHLRDQNKNVLRGVRMTSLDVLGKKVRNSTREQTIIHHHPYGRFIVFIFFNRPIGKATISL